MNKYCISVLILFIISFGNNAATQNIVQLQGKILDEKTNEPVEYSSIGLVKSNLFTTSNSEGEFIFTLPEKYINDSIEVSHIGYEKARYKIKNIIKKHAFFLSPKSILLDQVVVTDNPNKFAKEIIKKALDNIESNYPKDEFLLKGYFRKTQMIDSIYVSFLDAAVNLYDDEFTKKKNKEPEAVLVEAVRKSYDLNKKPFRSWIDKISNESNWLARLLKRNDVRYQNGLLNKKNKFTLSGTTTFNGEMCYIIEVIDLPWQYTKSIENASIKIIVGAQQYEIFRIEHREMTERIELFGLGKQTNDTIKSMFKGGVKVLEFKEIKDKLYLNYIREVHFVEDINIKTNSIEYSNIYSWELFINNVIENVDKEGIYKELNFNNSRDNFQILDKPYDLKFWNTFNLVPFSKENGEAFKDLSTNTEVQYQFENIID